MCWSFTRKSAKRHSPFPLSHLDLGVFLSVLMVASLDLQPQQETQQGKEKIARIGFIEQPEPARATVLHGSDDSHNPSQKRTQRTGLGGPSSRSWRCECIANRHQFRRFRWRRRRRGRAGERSGGELFFGSEQEAEGRGCCGTGGAVRRRRARAAVGQGKGCGGYAWR